MNPCPCGLLSDPEAQCVCSAWQVQRYRHKLSGPLLDRMDLFIEVPRLRYEEVTCSRSSEPSSAVAARVQGARERQKLRFEEDFISHNAHMGPQHVRQYCLLDAAGRDLMRHAFQRLHLSARAYDRILKVARTIADLDDEKKIATRHLAEAVGYRANDFNASSSFSAIN